MVVLEPAYGAAPSVICGFARAQGWVWGLMKGGVLQAFSSSTVACAVVTLCRTKQHVQALWQHVGHSCLLDGKPIRGVAAR